jgi:hypothetical protein
LNASLNFSPGLSNTFTLINNDGFDPVVGTFAGLPEGANLSLSGQQFQISYTGGDGNDVVLTAISGPARPTLSMEKVTPGSVRLLWPTNDAAYTVQFNTDLTTTNWTASTNLPVVLGTNYVMTDATVGTAKFYRLIK